VTLGTALAEALAALATYLRDLVSRHARRGRIARGDNICGTLAVGPGYSRPVMLICFLKRGGCKMIRIYGEYRSGYWFGS
jgi:hypothetical protein